ncbi:MAG TPA: hypothetical protein VFB68_00735 [Xanthobacteraceae bacterium]|nr:hypothetical protein [Xanthobacteraceae bacterium]
MSHDDNPPDTLGSALTAEGPERQTKLESAANNLRQELEQLAVRVTALVLSQPPTSLLGYIWAQVFVGAMRQHSQNKKEQLSDKDRSFELYQFALEYLHAAWSGNREPFSEGTIKEEKAEEVLVAFEEFRTKTMQYCLASSLANTNPDFGEGTNKFEFQAKTSWVLIRGHRHQVLEKEFFSFVLAPQEDALVSTYGVGSDQIASGIQQIADAFRMGYAKASEVMSSKMQEATELVARESITMELAIEKLKSADTDFMKDMTGAWKDLFEGGICNLSRQTTLPKTLLEDLAYEPGTETKFFEKGPLAGTPLRTLPARIRPLIRLNGDYYATDGQFVRDSAYRAIQRGLIARNPSYRESWNKKQKDLTEAAFPAILHQQLKGATLYNEVYFKDVTTGQWVETDTVGLLDDNLFIVEAKAGVMAMHSPATDFDRHIRAVQDLVVKAYRQCRRFVEYLASAEELQIFQLENGQHKEIARLRLNTFRKIIPIGLTVEAFTPFSAMCKELPEVTPILGKHPFISMSVDDLFVLNRFLPTTGTLFHYLDVRQQVAGIPEAMMFDEQDHLGAYLSRNRFDRDMQEQLTSADRVAWDAFSEKIEEHFRGEDWQSKAVPQQHFPPELEQMLRALDRARPNGWLKYDAFLRDLGGKGRENLASLVRQLLPTLKEHPVRSALLGTEMPLQVFLHRSDFSVPESEIRHRGEVACLIAGTPTVLILVFCCSSSGEITGATCSTAVSPPTIRADYAALVAEAEEKRAKFIQLGTGQARRPPEKLSKRAKRRNRYKRR